MSPPENNESSLSLTLRLRVAGREPITLGPGKVELLRKAFDDTMKDPEFLADGKTMQAEISPTSGAEAQALIARVYATPRDVVERAKRLITPAAK